MGVSDHIKMLLISRVKVVFLGSHAQDQFFDHLIVKRSQNGMEPE